MTEFSKRWVNLASAKLGARAISCSDDFFAPMHRMLQDSEAVFIDDKYDDHGKWMDGWESRRKRVPGHDWCVVKLAKPGVIHGIEIDTTHFTGNYPPAASVDVCNCDEDEPGTGTKWIELVPQSALNGDSEHQYAVNNTKVFTHVRLNIYPDGGVARLRVFAEPRVDWKRVASGELIDIAAALNGGVALAANNEHYGSIRNLLTPGRGVNMGDGWETRRRREPGNDWVVIALARPGTIREIEIDTAHFKGNYPDSCRVSGAHLDLVNLSSIDTESQGWAEILPRNKLQADHQHHFTRDIIDAGAVTHIRVDIYPDGGISRIRILAEVD